MLSGLSISLIVGILTIESSPNRGMAISMESNVTDKKLTSIIKPENKSWWNGFIPLNALKAMINNFQANIILSTLNN